MVQLKIKGEKKFILFTNDKSNSYNYDQCYLGFLIKPPNFNKTRVEYYSTPNLKKKNKSRVVIT